MKKQNNRIILIVLILSVILILPINPIVQALPSNWIEFTDFDEFNLGDQNGTTGNFMFNWTERHTWQIDGTVENKYLAIHDNTDSGDERGWLNDTAQSHRGYYFKLTEFVISDIYGHDYFYMTWYNTTGTAIIKLWIYNYAGGMHRYCYQDNDGDWNTLQTETSGAKTHYFYWNYYQENVIQYRMYSSNLVLETCVNDTGLISGVDFYNESQFNSSCCYIWFDEESTSQHSYFWLREYGYVQEDIYGSSQFPAIDGIVMKMNDFSGVTNVCVGSTVKLTFTAYGDASSRFCINITDANNDENLVWLCTLISPYSLYYTFNKITTITVIVKDAYYPEDYTLEESFNVVECGQPDYDIFYGNFYVEFFRTGEGCYYIDGDHPQLMLNLNDTENYNSYLDRYYIDIYGVWALGEQRFTTLIRYMNDSEYMMEVSSIDLYNQYSYEIRVYNTTFENGQLKRDTLVYTSDSITVCADSDNDGIGDDVDPDPFISDDDDGVYDIQQTDYSLMVGLGVTMGVGVFISMLLGSFMGFFVGAIPTAYFLSSEELSMFQCLPTELGIGLIVLLVIVAVIVWLIGS